MSNYQYNYNSPGRNSGGDDVLNWVIIVAALAAFWPLGLVLLFRRLAGCPALIGRGADGRYRYTGPFASLFTSGQTSGSATHRAAQGAPTGGTSPNGEYHYSYRYAPDARQRQQTQEQKVHQDRQKTQQEHQEQWAQASQRSAAAKEAPANGARAAGGTSAGSGASRVVTGQGIVIEKQSRSIGRGGARIPTGRGLIIAGAIVSGVFSIPFVTGLAQLIGSAVAGSGWINMLTEVVTLAGFLALGLVLLSAGLFKGRKRRRALKYLGLIGRRKSVSITTLAGATGRSYKKVCADLQDMLDRGILPVGYLDLANDRLVLSPEGIADEAPPEPEAAPAEPPQQDDDHILAEIREVNDQIADPVMSAKIDRIGEITGKILDYQRSHPGKASQLRSFLNYYLPTTLKILRAYGQLEQQGIEGENISAAKARIEGMMDKVVEGFEKQLDKLFQNDALDIATDVAVLEKMLDNDGLSQGGLSMGT